MKNIAGWVGASAFIAVLWGACTVTTDDGGGAGHSGGTGGSSTGTGGTSSTGGGGAATGGNAGATDGGPVVDATREASTVSACEQCGIAMCGTETNACNAAAGCAAAKPTFYACVASGEDFDTCALNFGRAMDAGGGGGLGNDLATCLNMMCDVCLAPPDGG